MQRRKVLLNPDRAIEHREYDIGIELRANCSLPRIENNETTPRQTEYLELLRSLNMEQKEFYGNVIHLFKTKQEPLYALLTGGAGVGKSVIIKALF